MTPAVRCRPCTQAQRACRPLYSRPASRKTPSDTAFLPLASPVIPNTPEQFGRRNSGSRAVLFRQNRPEIMRFSVPVSRPESHALWRRRWRRLSVPRCKAG
ncbi:hypothetical protein DW757_09310 [Clostridium sp. AM29-11AC]|nr:hypothetical protein DW757_09310 [Clostridium sp. AM29-11AC]